MRAVIVFTSSAPTKSALNGYLNLDGTCEQGHFSPDLEPLRKVKYDSTAVPMSRHLHPTKCKISVLTWENHPSGADTVHNTSRIDHFGDRLFAYPQFLNNV
jgi:hypothetical protein